MIYPEESNKIIELAYQLHNELGCGFKEKVYQDAFEVILKENGIPYEREKHIQVVFHGVTLKHDFYYDFLLWGKIGVEFKTHSEIIGEFESQLINYLHVGKHKLGVVLNFGTKSLEYRWLVNKKILNSKI
ncbi:MAG: GxxExxY protein [Bacteroidales bacterium]|nr:GxxExxY protein [Bacteroidales bacterium]